MKIENSQKLIIEQLSDNLEALEAYANDIWQFFPLPVCHVNPFQVILDANLALEEFFGWETLELTGEKVDIFFVDKTQIQKIYQDILGKREIIEEEGEVITKNGEKKIVNISARAREDSKGNIIGYYLALTDITELKELQKELEKKVEERTKELKERVAELERFQKLAVGRELKMAELKEEIEKLKEELEKYKGRS